MNKLLMTAAIATGFFFLGTLDVNAQVRVNPNAFRQSFVRPAPRPVAVVRPANYYGAAGYSYPRYVQPTYVTPYVNPYSVYSSSYYSPSYYPSAYPTYNSYYNPYAYPSYYPSSVLPYSYGYYNYFGY